MKLCESLKFRLFSGHGYVMTCLLYKTRVGGSLIVSAIVWYDVGVPEGLKSCSYKCLHNSPPGAVS